MKLELKYIAPYLPYGLLGRSTRGTIFRLNTYSDMNGKDIENRMIDNWLTGDIKPLLYPLSSVDKDSISLFGGLWIEKKLSLSELPYADAVLLFAGQFDVFNLIENNLAISK